MLDAVRERVSRWMGREVPAAAAAPPDALIFADHEEIRDIARQMTRTRVELDRSVLALRAWGRDLGRRLEQDPAGPEPAADLRALGETAGGLAHNFNNSLAAILAYTELLLKETRGDTAQRRLRMIRDVALEASVSVRRFQELVSREPQVGFGPVAVAGVVAEALEMTAPRWRDEAQRRGIAVEVATDVAAVPPVEGNAVELRDMLTQLIQNAVSAMPRGGALTIRGAAEAQGWAVLEVQDTGVGMPEDVRRRIADGTLSAESPHATRGLAGVSHVVERHGGTIAVETAEGRGTTVRLRLPASRFQIIPPSAATAEPPPADEAVGVLLVDDDQRLLGVMADMLREGGHAVTTAVNGEEALAVFDPEAHDVVITDLGMPRVNGWEVAERIKARAPSTRVVLLTGWGDRVTNSQRASPSGSQRASPSAAQRPSPSGAQRASRSGGQGALPAGDEGSRFVDQVIAKPISGQALLAELAGLRRTRRGRA